MWVDFKEYWLSLYRGIPSSVYIGVLVVFVLAVLIILAFGTRKNVGTSIARILFAEYVFLIYCSTVIFRGTGKEIGYSIMPFWSYGAYFRGENPTLLVENIMNVAVFVLVGILLRSVDIGSRLTVKKEWLIPLAVGLCISVSIEMLQLVLKKGFAEVDDVMHNTMGCIIGYILVNGSRLIKRRNGLLFRRK